MTPHPDTIIDPEAAIYIARSTLDTFITRIEERLDSMGRDSITVSDLRRVQEAINARLDGAQIAYAAMKNVQ